MSLRRFCGWEPVEWTEHHPADGDKPARSVTRREVEWDDRQRAWMLALDLFERQLCKRCGHNLYETTSSDWDWVPNDPDECGACASLARSERSYADKADEGSTPPEAMIHTVRRVKRMTVAERKRLMLGG